MDTFYNSIFISLEIDKIITIFLCNKEIIILIIIIIMWLNTIMFFSLFQLFFWLDVFIFYLFGQRCLFLYSTKIKRCLFY